VVSSTSMGMVGSSWGGYRVTTGRAWMLHLSARWHSGLVVWSLGAPRNGERACPR
jgi:hypothetical protein